MKRLIVGFLAALLLSAGLVAPTTTASNAAECPYTGCISTVTTGTAKSPGRGKAKVRFRVSTVGSAVPKGRVRIIIRGKGKFYSKVVPYPASRSAVFRGLPKGRYTVTIKFIPGASTAYARSGQVKRLNIR